MPTSDYYSDVLHVIEQINPESILDIGVGFGKWGVLCREILEIYQGRYYSKDWKKTIDGIEIFESYRNEFWELVYNNIYVGDAMDAVDRLGMYDLILCCDVIEHFVKDDGLVLLEKLLQQGKKERLSLLHLLAAFIHRPNTMVILEKYT